MQPILRQCGVIGKYPGLEKNLLTGPPDLIGLDTYVVGSQRFFVLRRDSPNVGHWFVTMLP